MNQQTISKYCFYSVVSLTIMLLSITQVHATCLSMESINNNFGYWINGCGYRVSVAWNDEGSCSSKSYSKYPCLEFVPAYGKSSASLNGYVRWVECEYPDAPKEESDGEVYCR